MVILEMHPQTKKEIKMQGAVEFNYEIIYNDESPLSLIDKTTKKPYEVKQIKIYHIKRPLKYIGSFIHKKYTKTFSKNLEKIINNYFKINNLVNIKWTATNKNKFKTYKGTFTQEKYKVLS